MPRRKVTEPTNIYWLYDTRPEKVAVHGEAGEPFYCGKTMRTPQRRLNDHRSVAKRTPNGTKTSARINICGDFISSRVVETVPACASWGEREQFWIDQLRAINPECTNIAKGGSGAAGNVWTPEQRAALSTIRKGHRHSDETRAKISRANNRRVLEPVWRARMPRALSEKAKNQLLIETFKCLARLELNEPERENISKLPAQFAHLAKLSHFERFRYLYD